MNPNDPSDQSIARILIEALPYIRRYQGKMIVIKYGGNAMVDQDLKHGFARDVIMMKLVGMNPVIVHGGGPQISELLRKIGKESTFIDGLRVTDSETMDIVEMVLGGLVNKEIVSLINSLGGKAVGLSGVDGGMLRAQVMDPELGLVGSVVGVDVGPIRAVTAAGFMPVIAPVAVHDSVPTPDSAAFLNVNADTAAGEIAAELGAERLVFMTDVDGVMDSSRRRIARLTERQARGLMSSNVIAGGMLPKIGACLTALNEVGTTHIIDGRKAHTLRDTLEGKALGTRVG